MRGKIIALAIFLCGCIAGAFALSFYQDWKRVDNIGRVRAIGVEVYTTQHLNETLKLIDWGTVDVGSNTTHACWVKNTGNDEQRLRMWTENWNPINTTEYIDLSWDYQDQWIPSQEALEIVFTLTVDADVEGITNFSFDIWIQGIH